MRKQLLLKVVGDVKKQSHYEFKNMLTLLLKVACVSIKIIKNTVL